MSCIMEKKEYFNKLIKEYRLPEAAGYVASCINNGEVHKEWGADCIQLILTYKKIVCDALWDKESVLMLSMNNSTGIHDDIIEEKKRLIKIIKEWSGNDKKLVLSYISAYYALTNEDRLHLNTQFKSIWEELKKREEKTDKTIYIGGYEEFQILGNKVEQYCNLNGSIFDIVKKFRLNIQLFK